jgi:hypothetical protein
LSALLAAASSQAEAIDRTTGERLPAFIDRVVATVLAAGAVDEARTG